MPRKPKGQSLMDVAETIALEGKRMRKPRAPKPVMVVISEKLGPPVEEDLVPEPARTEPGFRLESHPVEAPVPLVTIGPGHHAWSRLPFDVEGAIVWLQPPEGTSEEEVRRVAEVAYGTGALAVRLDRVRKSAVVPARVERVPHARARDVVIRLARAANVPDREKLAAFCEAVMAKAGVP